MSLNLNKWGATLALLLLGAAFWAPRLNAVTLKELRDDAKLTPETLMHRFANFKFRLSDEVQPRNIFLASQTGDCDDFATLAADVLREKGYGAHLIAVFMERQVHVVCYVAEATAYLDYNNRKKASPLVSTNGRLPDMADQVAQSFRSTWSCVMEYTFQNGLRHPVATEFRQKSPHTAKPA